MSSYIHLCRSPSPCDQQAVVVDHWAFGKHCHCTEGTRIESQVSPCDVDQECELTTMNRLAEDRHLCCITENDEQFAQMVNNFLLAGVLSNEKILYLVADDAAVEKLLDCIRPHVFLESIKQAVEGTPSGERRITMDNLIQSGQIVFFRHNQYYTEGNFFDPDRSIRLLQEFRQKALSEGYRGLRVTGCPTWAPSMEKDQPGTLSKFMEYEAKLNRFFAEFKDVHGWCQYNKDSFGPSMLLEVLTCHARVTIGRELFDNFYYIPPEDYLDQDNLNATTLQYWMANLREKKRIDRSLLESNKELKKANTALQMETGEKTRAREERARADAANKAKSLLIATISHEIRTPLTGIIGSTSLLLNSGTLSEEHKESIRTIESSGDHLLSLINDVLTFSKLELDLHIALESKPFSLSSCVKGVLEMCKHRARDRDLDLSVVGLETCPDFILGDVTRIRQVLLNLVSNACKFTPDGGKITLTVAAQPTLGREGLGTKSLEITFQVSDTGIGIPKSRFQFVFESFAQIDSSPERKYEGVGLGLAISKKLVEAWGGKLFLESNEGQGSCFAFTLPTSTCTPDTVPPSCDNKYCYSSPERKKCLNIMVVDDNVINQKVLCKMLEKLGHPPSVVASDGLQAVNHVYQRKADRSLPPFDVILLDLHMPKMSGLEAGRIITRLERDEGDRPSKIKSSVAIKKPLLVCISASVLCEDKEELDKAGFSNCLPKPLKLENLAALLQTLELDGCENRPVAQR